MCLQTVYSVCARRGTSSILAFDPGTLKIPSVLIPVCAKEVCTSIEKYREEKMGGRKRERERERERERAGRNEGRTEEEEGKGNGR